ncbi:MAG: mechanosensitive ion channel protein [Elainellaceae cyanobacterium]
MLLLTADQVTHCQLIRLTANMARTLDGIAYRNQLFTQLDAFPKAQKSAAVKQAKDSAIENKGKHLILVIETDRFYTIWQEDDTVRLKALKNIPVQSMNLEELIAQMRNVGGIKIKDRHFNLKLYPRCFVGSEAVTWLMQTLQISQQDAVRLGQRLMDEGWIHHVIDEHPFECDYLFYRFYWDE